MCLSSDCNVLDYVPHSSLTFAVHKIYEHNHNYTIMIINIFHSDFFLLFQQYWICYKGLNVLNNCVTYAMLTYNMPLYTLTMSAVWSAPGPEPSLCLLDVLKQRICGLLKEKEETVMVPGMAQGWLCKEAASVEAVTKAGTFR